MNDHVVASLDTLNGFARDTHKSFYVVLAKAEELSSYLQNCAWHRLHEDS